MRRDDWKYDEDAWDEKAEEETHRLSPEKQCPVCFHWIDREAIYCSWCGKSPEERAKR